jgi:hypothetical protein
MQRNVTPILFGIVGLVLGSSTVAMAQGVSVISGLPGYEVEKGSIAVINGRGGSIAQHTEMWRNHARTGGAVRISGDCRSACTLVFGQIPRSRICISAGARLGFHRGRSEAATQAMWRGYPPGMRAWINANGGMTPSFIWMSAEDAWRLGFKRC